jgi:hypothetical protein
VRLSRCNTHALFAPTLRNVESVGSRGCVFGRGLHWVSVVFITSF